MKTIVMTSMALLLAGTIAMAQTQKPVEKKEPVKTTMAKQDATKPVAEPKTANVQTKAPSTTQQIAVKAEQNKSVQASTNKNAVAHKHHKKAQASPKVKTTSAPPSTPASKPAPASETKHSAMSQPTKK